MGPRLLPPHSPSACGFRHGSPGCGVSEGCDPPPHCAGLLREGAQGKEGAVSPALHPALPCSLG